MARASAASRGRTTKQPVEVEAAAVQVVGVAGAGQIEPGDQRVAFPVRGREGLGRQRDLARGRRAEDLGDPPARQPAAERRVQIGEGRGELGDGFRRGRGLADGARAVLQLQPRHHGIELALAVGGHGFPR